MTFKNELLEINGIGESAVKVLNKQGINSLKTLYKTRPNRYENRFVSENIFEIPDGENITIKGQVIKVAEKRIRRNLNIVIVYLKTEVGTIEASFFNQKYLKKFIMNKKNTGKTLYIYGKKEFQYAKKVQGIDYAYEGEGLSREKFNLIMPVYPQLKGLSNSLVIRIKKGMMRKHVREYLGLIPDEIIEEYDLLRPEKAIESLHFPQKDTDIQEVERTLKFMEGVVFFGAIKIKGEKSRVDGCKHEPVVLEQYYAEIPFTLTADQEKAIEEILGDMNSESKMQRLLMGDVGSGKTIVSFIAALHSYMNGYKAVIMAPTEILASQHYENMLKLWPSLEDDIIFMRGKMTKKQKDSAKERGSSPERAIFIGTHALFQKDLELENLGLVVIDEQHRFGVEQRKQLEEKGKRPNLLVMSATPIPRTLSMTSFGDLDKSYLKTMPNNKRIKTMLIRSSLKDRMYNFIREEIQKGVQVYYVCPLVEESDKLTLENAEKVTKELDSFYFKEYNIKLIHGKMKSREKEETMQDYLDGDIDILVATTVIEVGVDVKNANIIVIENAERFGLAQLHQLRGRVGRGEKSGTCILISDTKSEKSLERLKTIVDEIDGFKIAEKDLELRGPGEFWGLRQHGMPELEMIDLAKDSEILFLSKEIVEGNFAKASFKKIREKALNELIEWEKIRV